jgi:excisionase family DNA binding protein
MATSPTLENRRARRHPKNAEHEAQQRRWASMKQTADYMGVSLRTVREWISQGSIPGYRINARVIRVDLNEVDAAFRPFGGGV